MGESVLIAIIASVLTGAISAISVVAALRVHIQYLRENVTRVDSMAQRAHQRIDELPTCQHRAACG